MPKRERNEERLVFYFFLFVLSVRDWMVTPTSDRGLPHSVYTQKIIQASSAIYSSFNSFKLASKFIIAGMLDACQRGKIEGKLEEK